MFKLSIETNNAAFSGEAGGDGPQELARILRVAADRIESGTESGTLRDINGNTVGSFEYTSEA